MNRVGGFFCFLAYGLCCLLGFLAYSLSSLFRFSTNCFGGFLRFFSDRFSCFLGFLARSLKSVLYCLPGFFCSLLYVLYCSFLREHNKSRSCQDCNNNARYFHECPPLIA